MKKNTDIFKLTPEEEAIDAAFEKGEYQSLPKGEWDQYRETAHKVLKKESRINIRLRMSDLNRIKRIAYRDGLPYQTLISSVLHRFSTGQIKISDRS